MTSSCAAYPNKLTLIASKFNTYTVIEAWTGPKWISDSFTWQSPIFCPYRNTIYAVNMCMNILSSWPKFMSVK